MTTATGPAPSADTPLSLDEIVHQHITRVLAAHDGNISAAARTLGMHRRTLQRRLQRHSRSSPSEAEAR